MSLRDEIRAENKKNFENMNTGDKIRHFWHYYKFHVLVAVAVIALVVYFILHSTVFRDKPLAFSVYALNSNYTVTDDNGLVDAFINEFALSEGIDTEEYQVLMNASVSYDPSSISNYDMAIDMKLASEGKDGDIDILIGTPEQLELFVTNGFYTKQLDEYLPEELLTQLDEEGLVYYYTVEGSDTKHPIGIRIAGAARIQALGLYNEDTDAILSIVSYSEHTDTAVAFIRYLFETPENGN